MTADAHSSSHRAVQLATTGRSHARGSAGLSSVGRRGAHRIQLVSYVDAAKGAPADLEVVQCTRDTLRNGDMQTLSPPKVRLQICGDAVRIRRRRDASDYFRWKIWNHRTMIIAFASG
jgi:hypothetical protein